MTAQALKRGLTQPIIRVRSQWPYLVALIVALLFLVISVALPLLSLLQKAFITDAGDWIGLQYFQEYLNSPSFVSSIVHTLTMGISITAIVVTLAFLFAYGLTHTGIRLKGLYKYLAMLPIFAPSLLPAIALVYLFGNQGIAKSWLMGESIYGPIGIVLGMCFWIFPHVFMILYSGLQQCDGRLYEASRSLKASHWKTFIQVTLPNVRFALVSAIMVSFTLAVTDFGVPKVIGGQYNVLATDIYKQVIGQQNFAMGSVVSLVLLLPTLLSFVADRWAQKKQTAILSSKSTPLRIEPRPMTDFFFQTLTCLVLLAILGVILMAVYASFVTFWPYNLNLSFKNYQFDLMDGGGWASYFNSLRLATFTALVGTPIIFVIAWLNQRAPCRNPFRGVINFLALVPVAVPGMVLGLAYIFFFNHPGNWLHGIYGTMAILVLCTVVHFYTVSHMSSVNALKNIDLEFDDVSDSLRRSRVATFFFVMVPMCAPALAEVFMYLFINAMTTVSAVVFLYSSDTTLASIAVLNMDDAGDIAPAAAMATLIMVTCMAARTVYWVVMNTLIFNRQTWR